MERLCIVGLEESEYSEIQQRVEKPLIAHVGLPRIVVDGEQLLVERRQGPGFLPVSRVIFHGIYEEDLDFIAALALWGGPCLPNARAMMSCRLKLPCLIRALDFTRYRMPSRGYAGPDAPFRSDGERVAKWGNWHCGENKERFSDIWRGPEPCLIEPFIEGISVRVVIIGEQVFQIGLDGIDWRKSIHDDRATLMEPDEALVSDTMAVQSGFGLEVIANDYIVTPDGERYLLEVNHIPNVTRFSEIWAAYRDFAVTWVGKE